MTLHLEIELGNDAMETSVDAAVSIQRSLLEQTNPYAPLFAGQSGTVRDGNGNTVGSWRVEEAS
jgi:hypothetical protein